jgi:hypothetical protein
MKAIKNKKRFDPRWHHEERLESKEQDLNEINEIKVNFNSFNLDTWLEEEAIKEMQPGDGAREFTPREVPPEKRGNARKPDSQDVQDRRLSKLSNTELRRNQLEEEEVEEGCGDPEMGPEEAEPAITDLSPDEAFGAGYSAAVEEIMASIQGLLGDPMDMTSPEEMEMGDEEMVVQLPDHAMEMHEEAGFEDPEVRATMKKNNPDRYKEEMAKVKAATEKEESESEPGSRAYANEMGDRN